MRLTADEGELVAAEASQAAAQVSSPELRQIYADLAEFAAGGELPEELAEPLEGLLRVGLESGRIRRLYTAHGELLANHLYARTPRGRALLAASEAVNEALKAVAGQTLEEVAVRPAGPGGYEVTLRTGEATLLVQMGRDGVRIRSLEVG